MYNTITLQHYYGVRSSEKVPEVDFINYFSSSKPVKNLVKLHGKGSFIWKIRKLFTSRSLAKIWERKFLTRIDAKNRKDWLNQTNDDYPNFDNTGKKFPPRTLEHRLNLSKACKGIKKTEEQRKRFIGNQYAKGKTWKQKTRKLFLPYRYEVVKPNGEKEITQNVEQYSRDHRLDPSTFRQTMKNNKKHKGYSLTRLTPVSEF